MSKRSDAIDIPIDQLIWVDTETAAKLLFVSPAKFNSDIRTDPKFVRMGIERAECAGRFSLELLRKYGRGEYR